MSQHPPQAHDPSSGLLNVIAARIAAGLVHRPDAVAFLRSQGITDADTIAALRVGAGAPGLLDGFDLGTLADLGLFHKKRTTLLGPGVSLPLVDPRRPGDVLAFSRLWPVQTKHMVAGPRRGLACRQDIDQHRRVVLCESPLVLMRLDQLGCRHAALVEHTDVLAPLLGWFAGREVLVVGQRKGAIARIRDALGPHGARAMAVGIQGGMLSPSDATLEALGIDPATVARPEEPAPPITPRLCLELHGLARRTLESGEASEILRTLEADTPEMVTAYQIGYLTSYAEHALPSTMQKAIRGHRLGNCIVMPAYDEQGLVVDLHVVYAGHKPHGRGGLHDQPLGLLGPTVSKGAAEVIVTDTFPWLGRLYKHGYRNVVLLRSVVDAEHNAARLVGHGVQRVLLRARRHADAYARVLRAAGLVVEINPRSVVSEDDEPIVVVDEEEDDSIAQEPQPVHEVAPPTIQVSAPTPVEQLAQRVAATATTAAGPRLRYVEEDRREEVVIYEHGPLRYAVESRPACGNLRQITVRGHGQSTNDRFDLGSEAQRARFAGNAARKVGVQAARIQADLAELFNLVIAREEAFDEAPAVAIDPEHTRAAERMLASQDLMAQIEADMTGMGWVGEGHTKRLMYLVGISRLLPRPAWAAYRANGVGVPGQVIGIVAALTPPEHRVVVPRLTEVLLAHTDQRALRHRLLILDHAEALRPEAALALRVLHERGGVGWGTAGTAVHASSTSEAKGPVAVIAATSADLDARCRGCFMTVPADETQQQVDRVLAEQRRLAGLGASAPDHAAIINRHHAAQRLLKRYPVRVPFASRIAWPSTGPRSRQEQATFLALVQASALLHQCQRQQEVGTLLASEADFDLVRGLVQGLLGVVQSGLGMYGRLLLDAIGLHHLASFTSVTVHGLLPEMTEWAFRMAVHELRDRGLLMSSRAGRSAFRVYRLTDLGMAALAPSGIHLRRVGDPGSAFKYDGPKQAAEAREVGGGGPVLNVEPVRHVG